MTRSVDPAFSTPYGIAARCYYERKSFAWAVDWERESEETRRMASRILQIGRDDGVALSYAGRAMGFVCHDYDIATTLVEEALVANPNLAQAWLCSGQVNTYRGSHAEGIAQIKEVLRMSPVDPERHLFEAYLSYACSLSGKYDEAIAYSSIALSRQPNAPPALRASVVANALSGNVREARRIAGKLRQIAPGATLSYLLANRPPYRRKEDVEKFAEGLRIAGF